MPNAAEAFIEKLRRPRHDYEKEARWHKFLLDAFAGTGGFQGRERMEFAGYWGRAADVYGGALVLGRDSGGESQLDTYLDRFPREDEPKFRDRVGRAHYDNYVEPIVAIRLSFMHRKPMGRDLPDPLQAWTNDADGGGTSWDELVQQTIDLRAAIVGWCPVLFDLPEADGEMSRAHADELGVRVKAIPLFPANLLDYDVDLTGRFAWAKSMVSYCERLDPLGPTTSVQRITIWEPSRIRWWELARVEDEGGRQGEWDIRGQDERPNPFAEVPIRICRHQPVPNDPVKGIPMGWTISNASRALFNRVSELEEHLRGAVFAFLQVPCNDSDKLGEVVIGTHNALPIHPDSKQGYAWISPDPHTPEIYERRIKTTIEEIYRMGRSEFTRASEGQARSGVSRAFEFEVANRAISDFAKSVADFEESAFRLVAKIEATETDADAIKITAPTKFDVEEMAKEIEEALGAVSLGLPPTAVREMKRRMVEKLLPNLDDKTRAEIEEELEQEKQTALRMQMQAELLEDEDPDQEDDDEAKGATEPPEDGDEVPPKGPRRGPPARQPRRDVRGNAPRR